MLRDVFSIYLLHIGKILLIGITMVLPLLLVHTAASAVFAFYVDDSVYANMFSFFFYVIVLWLIQVPYIHLFKQETSGEEVRLIEMYRVFFQCFFPVLLVGIGYGLLVVLGLTLLIIPGLIFFLMWFLYPYSLVYNPEKKWSAALRESRYIGLEHMGRLIIILSVGIGLTSIMGKALAYGAMFATSDVTLIILIPPIVQVFLLPILALLMSNYYSLWNEEYRLEMT
ncbi:hypothetical protein [Planifilum fimeticola]